MVLSVPANPNRRVLPFSSRSMSPSAETQPPFRVSSEFDSESTVFTNKVSCKLFDGLAKLKLSFQNDKSGQLSDPSLSFVSKNLSVHYDPEDKNAILEGSFDVGSKLRFCARHDVKAQQGEVAMVTNLFHPAYVLVTRRSGNDTSCSICRSISLEEREDEEAEKLLSVNGFLKGHILNGICNVQCMEEEVKLSYAYKDEQMSIIPSISLPSNALSFAFKRRLSPSSKLSYWYNFDSNDWSTVYKHKINEDYKFKAGYDSDAHLGWASIWVGNEDAGAKTALMKAKVQLMLQVPQDDIKASLLMFRVKKRWDF